MQIESKGFEVVDWTSLAQARHAGETGVSLWQTAETGNVRARVVEYSPGFRSDHWCPRGHVLLVLGGELMVRLRTGRQWTLKAGSGFVAASDEGNPHLVWTENGAKVFIVD